MLIDSHCHLEMLNLEAYAGDLSLAIKAAEDAGVGFILSVGTSMEQSRDLVKLVERYPNVRATVGVHPEEDLKITTDIDELIELANNDLVVGIGEVGLDYHYLEDDSLKGAMQERFSKHIAAARKIKKPLVIHSREASGDMLTMLESEKAYEVGGVLHCFSGDWEVAKKVLDMGFYLGFTGIVTFKNAELMREVLTKVPLDRILIETDAPFLAPAPYRGKPNEPKYLPYTAQAVADIKDVSLDEIGDVTTENFWRLFVRRM